MIRLSAAIITLNEEKNIGRCLESLRGVADEIVVVDSGSVDNTRSICEKHGARFVVNPFQGHIQQKNFTLTLCSNDYVLSLDADEALSPKMRESILAIKNNWEKDGYYFRRLTNYCGKWIHHCGWYPDKKLRMFRKGSGKWGGSNPHDRYELDDRNNHTTIDGDLLHYSYYTVEEHMRQANKFSDIAAESAFKNGERTSLLQIIFSPNVRFLRDYIFHLGILDGYYGLVICRISALSTFIKYVKLRELCKNRKPG